MNSIQISIQIQILLDWIGSEINLSLDWMVFFFKKYVSSDCCS